VLLIGVFKAHKLFVIEWHKDADNEWRVIKDSEEAKTAVYFSLIVHGLVTTREAARLSEVQNEFLVHTISSCPA